MKKNLSIHLYIVIIFVVILAGVAYAGIYTYESRISENQKNIQELKEKVLEYEGIITTKEAEELILQESLYREQNRNAEFALQIEQIAGTVGVLDKLAKTDKELLQKYSKVYFLNEHYTPEELSIIDPDITIQKNREEKVHASILPFLEKMIRDGEKDEVSLRVISAYRSFEQQTSLKSQYTVLYDTGANRFSADQGYSEHQLGTAVDFSTAQLGTNFTEFGDTKAYAWLKENAYKYGFILSYPPDNSYYQYEPWHWRFVGTKLARTLHNENMYFYDMEQREIDPYLISIFD